jgi:hypothetical protein
MKAQKTKTIKSPWNFEQPPYDQRSSGFINAGRIKGEGKRQPVGTFAHSNTPAVPQGRMDTLYLYADSHKASVD